MWRVYGGKRLRRGRAVRKVLQEISTYPYEQGKEHGPKVDRRFFVIQERKWWLMFILVKIGLCIRWESYNCVVQYCKYGLARPAKPTLRSMSKRLLKLDIVGNRCFGVYYSLIVFRDEDKFQLLRRPTLGPQRDYTTSREMPSQRLLRDWLSKNRHDTSYSSDQEL